MGVLILTVITLFQVNTTKYQDQDCELKFLFFILNEMENQVHDTRLKIVKIM